MHALPCLHHTRGLSPSNHALYALAEPAFDPSNTRCSVRVICAVLLATAAFAANAESPDAANDGRRGLKWGRGGGFSGSQSGAQAQGQSCKSS